MTKFALVLKDLYADGDLSSEKLYEFLRDGKITKEDYLEITRKDGEMNG